MGTRSEKPEYSSIRHPEHYRGLAALKGYVNDIETTVRAIGDCVTLFAATWAEVKVE